MGYNGKESVDMTKDKSCTYKGRYVTNLRRSELIEAVKDVTNQNEVLRRNAGLQMELSKQRLFGSEAVLRNIHADKWMEKLRRKIKA